MTETEALEAMKQAARDLCDCEERTGEDSANHGAQLMDLDDDLREAALSWVKVERKLNQQTTKEKDGGSHE